MRNYKITENKFFLWNKKLTRFLGLGYAFICVLNYYINIIGEIFAKRYKSKTRVCMVKYKSKYKLFNIMIRYESFHVENHITLLCKNRNK